MFPFLTIFFDLKDGVSHYFQIHVFLSNLVNIRQLCLLCAEKKSAVCALPWLCKWETNQVLLLVIAAVVHYISCFF